MEAHNILFMNVQSEAQRPDQSTQIGLGVLCLLSLLCGLMMKSIVFWHLSQTKIWSKPINILILTDELIYVSTGSYVLIQMLIWLFTQTHALTFFEDLFDFQVNSHGYCNLYVSIATFHYFYGTLGSFGISFHRYVLILKPHWVKRRIREEVLLAIVLSFCLSTNFVLVALYTAGNTTRRVAFNGCVGWSENFQV